MKLDVQTDRHLIRAGAQSDRYVLIHLTAPLGDRARERPPVNLGLVLDRSGSMSGMKIQLVRQAAERAIRSLSERDRFSLVVYDDRIDVVAENRHATPEAKRWAVERLRLVGLRRRVPVSPRVPGAPRIAKDVQELVLDRLFRKRLQERGFLENDLRALWLQDG